MYRPPIAGIIKGLKYKYEVILCKPDRTELMFIQYSDLSFTPTFGEFYTLNITINRLVGDYTGNTRVNPCWDIIRHDFLIHLRIKEGDDVIYREYFIIENPQLSGSDIDTYTLTCSSYEKNDFNNKILSGVDGLIRKLYDPTGAVDSNGIEYGIVNYILRYKLYNTWSVDYVEPELLALERVLTFSGQTLTSVFESLTESCRCVFVFNNVDKKISIYKARVGMLGENKGLVVAPQNYIKNISYALDTDGIKTRLFTTGKDNAVITRYNPTGQRYVDNFTYYLDNGYFSASLTTALKAYNALIESKRGLFESYLVVLDKDPTNATYLALVAQLRDDLLWERNFTQAQIVELVPFIKEEVLSISQISDSKQLYEYTVAHLATICFTPIQINIEAIDGFALEDYQQDWLKLTNIGDFCNIYYEEFDLLFKEIRLISYTHNPVTHSLSLVFSNIDELTTMKYNDFKFTSATAENLLSSSIVAQETGSISSNLDYVNTKVTSLEARIAALGG